MRGRVGAAVQVGLRHPEAAEECAHPAHVRGLAAVARHADREVPLLEGVLHRLREQAQADLELEGLGRAPKGGRERNADGLYHLAPGDDDDRGDRVGGLELTAPELFDDELERHERTPRTVEVAPTPFSSTCRRNLYIERTRHVVVLVELVDRIARVGHHPGRA